MTTAIPMDVPGAAPLEAYVARPEGAGPWPALLVIHEAFGLNEQTRVACDRLARMGFLTAAPDLYRGHALRCIRAVVAALASGTGGSFDDLEAVRAWLAASEDSTGSVGVVGFCMGGGFALMTASSGFGAAAVNYGMLPAEPDVTLAGACPVVGSYGGRDRSLTGAAARLEQALTAASIANDIKEYPEASHTFMNELRAGPAWFRPISRVMGFGPDPAAAADAWTRIDEFFRAHLTESPAKT